MRYELTVDDVQERVDRVERDRTNYRNAVRRWRRMAVGDADFQDDFRTAYAKGQEQVISPRPFNVLNLAMRQVGTRPKVEIPPAEATDTQTETAEKKERWLMAAWQQVNDQQKRNVIADAWQYIFRDGRAVFAVKWLAAKSRPRLMRTHFPISVLTVNPLDVGMYEGPIYPHYAYHKYTTTLSNVLQRFPELRDSKLDGRLEQKLVKYVQKSSTKEDEDVEVIDWWGVDPDDGEILNAVLVDDVFALKPEPSSYPAIPYVIARGDHFPGMGDEFDGMSLLAPMDGPWQAECRAMSYLSTGLLHHFWPTITYQNESGMDIPDFEILPGSKFKVPAGTKFERLAADPNVPILDRVLQQMSSMLDQATFPAVMWGENPSVQSGFALNQLAQAAGGRINAFKESMQLSVAHVNKIMLALVEENAGSKGVSIWGKDERAGDSYRLTLTPDEIDGYYENIVTLLPVVPADDTAKAALWLQWFQAGLVSAQTVRDKGMGENLPPDEQRRVLLDRVMNSEELQPGMNVLTLDDYFQGDRTKLNLLLETAPNLKAIAEQMGILPPPPPPPAAPPMGFEMGPDAAPPMMPPEQDPMMMGMDQGMGMPPPDMGMGMPPPPMEGQGIQPPSPFDGGMMNGGGMPPWMSGQLEPENVGLPPAGDPILSQQVLQGGMTDQDILDQLMMAGG
jgi:hypothetical protein